MIDELRTFNKRVVGTGNGAHHIVTVDDRDRVMESLQNGEPVTMKDSVLRPINSQKRKKLLDSITFFEAQLTRLQKQARDMRAEILSLTVSDD